MGQGRGLTNMYWQEYGNSRLHTNYHYFRKSSFYADKNKTASIELMRVLDAQKKLEAKEKAFYRLFGCETFEEFLVFLRSLMNSPDGQVLKRFSNESILENIIKKLEREHSKDLNTGIINITVNMEDSKKLEQVLKNLSQIKIKSKDFIGKMVGNFTLSMNFDVPSFKTLMDTYASKNFNRSSYNPDRLVDFLKQNQTELMKKFTFINESGRQISIEEITQEFKYRPYPWGYTNTELKEIEKYGDPLLKQQLIKAIEAIETEVLQLAHGGSSELMAAVKETLNNSVRLDYNIFFVGANYRNGLIGAFGEFGTAVLFNYLRRKYGIYNDSVAEKIIGSELLGKTDVQILGAFGVQVKNYATFDDGDIAYTFKDIESRQSPTQFAEYLDYSIGGVDIKDTFLGFLANYFFNSTIKAKQTGTFQDLKEFISQNLIAESFRLTTNNIEDTVTFYNVNMAYFIPGSMILNHYLQLQDLKVTITGPDPEYTSSVPSRGPNEFWRYNSGKIWTPTEKNTLNHVLNHVSIIATLSGFSMTNYKY